MALLCGVGRNEGEAARWIRRLACAMAWGTRVEWVTVLNCRVHAHRERERERERDSETERERNEGEAGDGDV
jgi:hypothetical protein